MGIGGPTRQVRETHAGPVWVGEYWQEHMIAENDPGSFHYMRDKTTEERNAMAKSIYEPSDAVAALCQPYKPIFDHVMIDIETMSLHKHKALILSVGMVEFDPRDDEKLHLGSQDMVVLEVVPQFLLGRRVDPGTQEFWIKEAKKEPRSAAHWLSPISITGLKASLETVRAFCKDVPNVWANGSQFDLSNLEGLADDLGEKELWHYQAPRDMRTFMKTTKSTRVVPIGDALDIPGVPHDPIYDCISQAYRVWGNWQ